MMAMAHIHPNKQRNVGVVTEQRSQDYSSFFLQSCAHIPNGGKPQLPNCQAFLCTNTFGDFLRMHVQINVQLRQHIQIIMITNGTVFFQIYLPLLYSCTVQYLISKVSIILYDNNGYHLLQKVA